MESLFRAGVTEMTADNRKDVDVTTMKLNRNFAGKQGW
jgi:hypothetical protein